MLGSVIGAEGAILSVLLSISFMKKSNEKMLDASVLPYLSVKKDTIPSEHAYAFEYFKIRKDKTDFDGWRKFDFDTIIVETVGVGQSEIEIAALADITIVTVVPEAGDEIQTMKAGVMEIADIFVVNKADRPGADEGVLPLLWDHDAGGCVTAPRRC